LNFAILKKHNVLITGAPGIGKSEIVEGVVKSMDDTDFLLCHPVVEDPVDVKGLPALVDGKAEFLPYGNLRKLCEAKRRTVVMLDDLGQAPIAVQAAYMQLLLAREINGTKISDEVTFIAATNRHKDMAGVSGLIEPIKSRFRTIVELEINSDDWLEWAASNSMPPELVAFIRMRPAILAEFVPSREIKNSASPRTIAGVGKMINDGLPKSLEFETFCGAIGEGPATEFINFLKVYRDLPNPLDILKEPKKAFLPTEPSQKYALASALAYHATSDNFSNYIQYLERLGAEFNVMSMREAVKRNIKIMKAKDWPKWGTEYGPLMAGK
jgi:hypothetical protein